MFNIHLPILCMLGDDIQYSKSFAQHYLSVVVDIFASIPASKGRVVIGIVVSIATVIVITIRHEF